MTSRNGPLPLLPVPIAEISALNLGTLPLRSSIRQAAEPFPLRSQSVFSETGRNDAPGTILEAPHEDEQTCSDVFVLPAEVGYRGSSETVETCS